MMGKILSWVDGFALAVSVSNSSDGVCSTYDG